MPMFNQSFLVLDVMRRNTQIKRLLGRSTADDGVSAGGRWRREISLDK